MRFRNQRNDFKHHENHEKTGFQDHKNQYQNEKGSKIQFTENIPSLIKPIEYIE